MRSRTAAKGTTKKRSKPSRTAVVDRAAVALPRIEPQLASVAGDVPEGRDWLHEIKHDDVRVVAYLDGHNATLLDGKGHDLTRRFALIASALETLAAGRALILDGVIAAPDAKGATNVLRADPRRLAFFVFDLLWLGDDDLRGRPLTLRKRRLKTMLKGAKAPILYVDHVLGELGRALYGDVVRAGGAGIVSKRRHAHYVGGSSDTWVDVKPDSVRALHLAQLRQSLESSAKTTGSKKKR